MTKNQSSNKSLLKLAKLPTKWHDVSLDDFTDPQKSRLKHFGDNVEDYRKDGIGLYIYGPPGSGKSRFLYTAALSVMSSTRMGVRVRYFNSLVSMLTSSWVGGSDSNFFKAITYPDFLFVEDLGAEIKRNETSNLAKTVIEQILTYRSDLKKPTIISSRETPDNLSNIYGEGVSSKLKETSLGVLMPDYDYREKIRQENKKKYSI